MNPKLAALVAEHILELPVYDAQFDVHTVTIPAIREAMRKDGWSFDYAEHHPDTSAPAYRYYVRFWTPEKRGVYIHGAEELETVSVAALRAKGVPEAEIEEAMK